jgi:hypothetical protein
MTANPEDDQQRAGKVIAKLRKKLCEQAADLANSGAVPPSTVATAYLEAAVALALMAGTPAGEVAAVLRRHADRVQEEGGSAMASRN